MSAVRAEDLVQIEFVGPNVLLQESSEDEDPLRPIDPSWITVKAPGSKDNSRCSPS
jgi:hypothetical protein